MTTRLVLNLTIEQTCCSPFSFHQRFLWTLLLQTADCLGFLRSHQKLRQVSIYSFQPPYPVASGFLRRILRMQSTKTYFRIRARLISKSNSELNSRECFAFHKDFASLLRCFLFSACTLQLKIRQNFQWMEGLSVG